MATQENIKQFFDKEIKMPRWGWLSQKHRVHLYEAHNHRVVNANDLRAIGDKFKALEHRRLDVLKLLKHVENLHVEGNHVPAINTLMKHIANEKALDEFINQANIVLEHGGITDVGKKRRNNEDSFLIDKQKKLYVVADGMGGHHGGEDASQTAVKTLAEHFNAANPATLLSGLHNTHSVITALNNGKYGDSNMGTTLTALHIDNNGKAHIAHVGDSRVYRLRDNVTVQLTKDHNAPWAQNILMQVIGIGKINPFTLSEDTRHNDVYLLTSDGVDKHLDRLTIGRALAKCAAGKWTAARTAKLIKNLANKKGGSDNITAIVVKVKKGS